MSDPQWAKIVMNTLFAYSRERGLKSPRFVDNSTEGMQLVCADTNRKLQVKLVEKRRSG